MNSIIRSPFFYVGDKYKLMPRLLEMFPTKINGYYEPFCGGGSSFLNTVADKYFLNDANKNVIDLHKYFKKNAKQKDIFLRRLYKTMDYYKLSCSQQGITASDEIKKKYPKTYFAKINKQGYLKMRSDYNSDQTNLLLLYVLLIYGFNHMIRFNSTGKFNLPVGNVDFNKNVIDAILNYFKFIKIKKTKFFNYDYKEFLIKQVFEKGDFVFFDPPYLISQSEYNKMWDESKEHELYLAIDKLNESGIKFGLTNLVKHKGRTNTILQNWMKKYTWYSISSNYISFNDNTIKKDSKEVYITNEPAEKKTIII